MKTRFVQNLLVSLLLPCLAAALQWVFWEEFRPFIWFLFYPAVFFSAQIGGRWGGMAATLLSVFLVIFFYVEPSFSLKINRVETLYSVTVFILMGFFFSNLQENLRRGQQKLQASEAALRTLNAEVEKRAETDLNRVLERLNLATRAAQIGIWDWDIQKNELVWDAQMYALYGLRPGDFGGAYEAWLQGVDPADRELSHAISAAAVRGEQEYDTEFRVRWPDGSLHWLKANGQVYRDEKGTPLRMVGINYEITKSKLADQALRESETQYRNLFEHMAEGYAYCQMLYQEDLAQDWIYVSVNAAFEQQTGLKDVTGKLVSEVIPGIRQTDPGLFEIYSRVALTGQPEKFEMFVAGLQAWFSVSVHSPKKGFFVSIFDVITARKQAEAALREREQKLTRLLEILPVGISILDGEHRLVYENPALEKILGINAEGLARGVYKERQYLTADGKPMPREGFASAQAQISGQPVYNVETGVVKENGERIWTSVSAMPVDFADWKIVIVTAEITALREAAEQVRQSEAQLRALVTSLDDLVFEVDEQGTYLNVWTNNEALLFLPRAEILGKRFDEIFGEAAARPFFEFLERTLQTNTPQTLEYPVELAGTQRWYAAHYNLIQAQPETRRTVAILVRDITERKQAERKLSESEEFLRLAYEAADLGIWKNDLQTGQVEFDERARLHYGFDTLQTTLAEVTNRIHPEDAARLGAEIAAATAPTSSGKFATEYRVIHPDGSLHWLAISVRVTFASEGEKRHAVMGYGTSLEITERKQADEALRQSEQKYSALFEKLAVPAALTKMPTGVFADVNEAFQANYGYSHEELIGKTSVEIGMARPDERAQSYLDLEKYGTLRNNEKHLFTKAGQLRIGAININKVLINGQDYVITTIHDVTDRKRAEEALRQRTEELEQLLDLLPEAIWIADDPECRVIHGNRFANELLGVTEKDNISQSAEAPMVKLRQFSQGRELDPDELPMQAAARTGQPQLNFELQIDRPDHIHTLLGGAVPLFDPAGQPRGVVAAFHDITERKQMEDELRRSNTELEQFAYVASHDLQEPLRAVAGMVQLLGQRYQGQLDARADEYIGHAVEASQRMQNLINDLLDYSRVGRFGQPFTLTALESSVKAALANLELVRQESQAEITCDPLPTLPVDPGQMTQVFQNLLSNALKFRGEAPPRIHIRAEKVEGTWRIAVSDNGIGIDPRYFERIFLVFQRLHTRREYPGTGIGLALCQKIIERHGGKIWVESTPGQGATFYFTLPERKP